MCIRQSVNPASTLSTRISHLAAGIFRPNSSELAGLDANGLRESCPPSVGPRIGSKSSRPPSPFTGDCNTICCHGNRGDAAVSGGEDGGRGFGATNRPRPSTAPAGAEGARRVAVSRGWTDRRRGPPARTEPMRRRNVSARSLSPGSFAIATARFNVSSASSYRLFLNRQTPNSTMPNARSGSNSATFVNASTHFGRFFGSAP